ncbi:MAG TPA: four helix bundle protein [Chitinophagaceae bacterium]|jgi:hypothetical protein|nr:four helix bundle protein [Chitinophagaceae bacterium]
MIKTVLDLEVYVLSYRLAMDIFKTPRKFPKEERFSLTDQLVRSSRGIAANIAEGWEKGYMKMNLKNTWSMEWVRWKRQKHGYLLLRIVCTWEKMNLPC